MDGLSNLSKRKLGRRDATGFKKLPHSDDFLFWQIAMSVHECTGTRVNPARETSRKLLLFFSEPEIDHFVMAITAGRWG
jgi:glycerol uptake facilitator-like aquaporin